MSDLRLWVFNEDIELKTKISESVKKLCSLGNHLYVVTISNNIYHGVIQVEGDKNSLELEYCQDLKVVDIDSCKEYLYIVNSDGHVYKCNENLEILEEVNLLETYKCIKGHNARRKVKNIAVGEYGQLFITEDGSLWGCGYMPQIGISTEKPKKVDFFAGRFVFSVNVGYEYALVIVSKHTKSSYADSEEYDCLHLNCPQCVSLSQLPSPVSQNSASDACPFGVKVQSSYDIETTSTSSKNSSNSFLDAKEETNVDVKTEKNIIFRNTEAAKEFLTKQISRMSSASEEYFVECTEKPGRIIKENVSNVANLVYEGVKTVGDKVVTLSRHVSAGSDCNSTSNSTLENGGVHRICSRDEISLSISQGTSERDLSDCEIQERVNQLLAEGCNLLNCEVWTWGNIVQGHLGIGENIKRERPMIITKLSNIGVIKASVQSHHASVLTLDGRAFIWGQNNDNQVTIESNTDQSSPKLLTLNQNDRVKDIVCGAHYTMVLTNRQDVIYFGKKSGKLQTILQKGSQNKISLFKNLTSNQQFTLLNVERNMEDSRLSNFLSAEQKVLEEMLVVQTRILKPLKKASTIPNFTTLHENLCKSYVDLLYFMTTNVRSLIDYSNNLISICDITIIKYYEEHIIVYKNYLNIMLNVISIDGFQNISKSIDISQNVLKSIGEMSNNEKNNTKLIITSLLMAPLKRLHHYTYFIETYCKENEDIMNKWHQLVEYHKEELSKAELTRDFWFSAGKNMDSLKTPERRLIRSSQKSPIALQNAGRFSSHRFVLFSDLLVHLNGSSFHLHNLKMIWIETKQDEICLTMPEDTLTLITTDLELKTEWLQVLQQAVKDALNKPEAVHPPAIRSGSYTFTKNGFLKNAKYTGRWLNGKMHGNGKLEWDDGKLYTGQFNNNLLSGYGVMEIPNIGRYEGEWKENQQNGVGTFTYANTDVYKGHFKDGVPHGYGFLRKGNFLANTASLYVGDFVCGVKCGYGVMDDIVSGEKYMGCWLENKKHGNGLIITSDGIYYEGIFSQDILSGHGVMILEDGTHYEGEFRGTGVLNGKGVLILPSGHKIEGNLNGMWNEGIKISGNLFKPADQPPKLPESFETLCTPANEKWTSLFKHCYQVLGISESNTSKNNTQKVWQNVAVYLSNAMASKRNKEQNKITNFNHLDIIPHFGRDKINNESYAEIKNYLTKAFESNIHPLGSVLSSISEAYTTTYGGKVHPLLLTHAIAELVSITERLYELIRFLFPALPTYGNDCVFSDENNSEDFFSYQSLVYPVLLPKIYNPLFTLLTLKNEMQEKDYKRTLMEWNKRSDGDLMAFLSVDQKFLNIGMPEIVDRNYVFVDAIESLQQIKSMFSPTEKLTVIKECIEKMTPVAHELLGKNYVWNMDDLFPLFLYVVVRSRIPDLGAELEFMEQFMDPSLENGELGIMFTTLKACYQQILQEKSSGF